MAPAGLHTGALALLGHMLGHDWGAGGWVLGIVGFVIMVTLVVLVIYLLVRSFSHQHDAGAPGVAPGAYPPPLPGDALDIARRRYAAGEITKEQLEEIQKTLKGE